MKVGPFGIVWTIPYQITLLAWSVPNKHSLFKETLGMDPRLPGACVCEKMLFKGR